MAIATSNLSVCLLYCETGREFNRSLPRHTSTTPPRHPSLGNGQSGMGNRGGRPPHTAPHRVFVTAAPPRRIISHSHHSPFPIAHSQGRGDVGRPIPKGGVTWEGKCRPFRVTFIPVTQPDLSPRLQAALGDAYRIDRELPGGGM